MLTLENEYLYAQFHPKGAAIDRLFYKPFGQHVLCRCDKRDTAFHYCNTVVGPLANRVQNAQFTLRKTVYTLDANERSHCLHGGTEGLSELEWQVENQLRQAIVFSLQLPHLHMGFPGPSHYLARYELTQAGIRITLSAQSPRDNAFNLAPHLYFNLDGSAHINEHLFSLGSAHYLPTNCESIPTGEIASVARTDFDFQVARRIGSIAIDHNFCFTSKRFQHRGQLVGKNGLKLSILSNQTGLQIYDARHMGRSHLAIEPQGWPNAVNERRFSFVPTPAGTVYRNVSEFRLSHS